MGKMHIKRGALTGLVDPEFLKFSSRPENEGLPFKEVKRRWNTEGYLKGFK